MSEIWERIFDNYGIKQVSETDKTKSAYVPNAGQRKAIMDAGVKPASERPAPEFLITVLFDSLHKTVRSSYYHSERLDPNRTPEPRMGHEIISSWLDRGDRVLIGNIGKQVFALKLGRAPVENDAIMREVVQRSDPLTILARAKAAKKGPPPTREVKRSDFVRNPYVVAAALIRANERCEMPGCNRDLFEKSEGTVYLEVHHVIPLGEGGDDVLGNVAALCPHCHREQHFGKDRASQRESLIKHVAKL